MENERNEKEVLGKLEEQDFINYLRKETYTLKSSYPNCQYAVGDIIEDLSPNLLIEFPHLYKRLKWWERFGGDFNSLFRIKYVKVIEYVGYYRVGDIVEVSGYDVELTRSVYFRGFYLGHSQSHMHNISTVIPASKKEYEEEKEKLNKSIKQKQNGNSKT